MPNRRTESPVDARLAELDRELRKVRRSIRAVARGDVPEETARRQDSPAPAPETADADARHGELFAHAARGGGAPRRAAGGADDQRRFAHYFASGSFARSRPLREERRIQRNKALYMVILAIVVALVLFRLLR